ncbi:MAG: ABC transporter ATP-binding protein [Bacteroidetes bacterium]|nr:MAG: ABC transporter ATP-binding protein [Bacteroidota bacterium]
MKLEENLFDNIMLNLALYGASMDQSTILDVRNLTVAIGESAILSDVSFSVRTGQRIGIAGPSGSGKTMLAWTIMSGQPPEARVSGNIRYRSTGDIIELLSQNDKGRSLILGKEVAIIPQNPYSSLNPSMTCGAQIREAIKEQKLSRNEVKDLCIETLQEMGFEDPQRIDISYPHQLSGGQLQRVIIVMAIINKPRLLIADEPTTALDTMTTLHILTLMDKWVKKNNTSLLLISHDWTVLSKMCDMIISLKDGRVVSVNEGDTIEGSEKMLSSSSPKTGDIENDKISDSAILKIDGLSKSFAARGKRGQKVVAVHDLSLELAPGESLGIVGESGSGKSTLAKLLTGLEVADKGTMTFENHKIDYAGNPFLRKEIQMIFQDPYSALYPHRTVGYSIDEPLKLHHRMHSEERRVKVMELMHLVDLDSAYYDRLPGKLSGGERQRVQIARALSVDPRLLICDECIAGLDIPVQARILELLQRLTAERKLSLIFISHDLHAVRFICDKVAVMAGGQIVEKGRTQDILSHPQHEITKNLVSSVLVLDE